MSVLVIVGMKSMEEDSGVTLDKHGMLKDKLVEMMEVLGSREAVRNMLLGT